MTKPFWKSSGYHLVTKNSAGWLNVTPDLIRAYLTRPEVHPVDDSCAAEIALFEALMADPFLQVPADRLKTLADQDTAGNYRTVLSFRDTLVDAGTLEAAYLTLMLRGKLTTPPVFIDQLVHIIATGILADATDPMRLRAAELFFREQTVNTADGRVILADHEIVEMHAGTKGLGSIGQLLTDTNTPVKQIELDVLDDDNAALYWERSDRFDTVVDMRFGQPANHAFARVMEAWTRHFLGLDVRIQPLRSIKDEAWRWHIGLDRDATEILNALYNGDEISEADQARLLALYKLEILDQTRVTPEMTGKPVYLALGCGPNQRVRVKPQNLLVNLPLKAADA